MRAALPSVMVVASLFAGACAPPPVIPSPSPSASASPTAPAVATLPAPTRSPAPPPTSPLVCEGRDPRANSGDNDRWTVLNPCAATTGTVRATSIDANGDVVLTVDPDYGQEAVLNARNVADRDSTVDVRFICAAPATTPASTAACAGYVSRAAIPAVGAHVDVHGALVRDGVGGAQAIRPVWEASTIATPAILAPIIVLQTRLLWKQIRAAWPAIPPALVLGQADPPVYAYAALYDDGIAHVFIRESDVFDPHQIWHEAGHILHAIAMQARGKRADLFTAADTVGQEFWTARKLPFAYKDFIATGNWITLSYEELAECFAAVNLNDAERTESYHVPLDRPAMTAFFRGVAPSPTQ